MEIKINDMQAATMKDFAAAVEPMKDAVSVLPNVAVWSAVSRVTRRGDATLRVAANSDDWTVYQVLRGKDVRSTLLVDATNGETVDLLDVAMDDDEREEWSNDQPLLADLLSEIAF